MSPPNTSDNDTTPESTDDDEPQFDAQCVDNMAGFSIEGLIDPLASLDIPAMLKQIDGFAKYLKKHHPLDILIPIIDKSESCRRKGDEWTWAKFDECRIDRVLSAHSEFGILSKTICIVEFEGFERVAECLATFPELGKAPMAVSKEGVQFFFVGGARGGLIVVPPAGERRWVRAPSGTVRMRMISDRLRAACGEEVKGVFKLLPQSLAAVVTGTSIDGMNECDVVVESMETPSEQINLLADFLREHHNANFLMPVWGPGAPINPKTEKPFGKKEPKHRHVDGRWSWAQFDTFRKRNPLHQHYGILLQSLCVVDFDSQSEMIEWKAIYPELMIAPMETTSKGGHFFFNRSELADSDEYYDGARQHKDKHSVDMKSKCSTMNGGLLVVCPSETRQWLRPLWVYPLSDISDELLKAVAVSRKKEVKQNHEQVHAPTTARAWSSTSASDLPSTSELFRKQGGFVPVTTLRRIVNALNDSRAIPRKEWLDTILAIHLVSVVNGYAPEGRAIALAFCVRGGGVADEADTGRTYDSATLKLNGLGIASLLMWLKSNSPGEFRAVQKELKAAEQESIVNLQSYAFMDQEENTRSLETKVLHADVITDTSASTKHQDIEVLRMDLVQRWPEQFGELNSLTFRVWPDADVIRFTDGHVDGYIKNHTVYLRDNTYLGLVVAKFRVAGPFVTHKVCPPHLHYNGSHPTNQTWLLESAPSQLASTQIFLSESDDKARVVLADIRVAGRVYEQDLGLKRLKDIQDKVMAGLLAAVAERFGPRYSNIIMVNNGTIIVNPGPTDDKSFEILRNKLDVFTVQHQLRKNNGLIYEPVAGCPCAYGIKCTFQQLINSVLKGDKLFRSNKNSVEDLVKYLTDFEEDELPLMFTDMDLISFANGVLELAKHVFTPYSSMATGCDLSKRVARHHIPLVFNGCADTPLLDVVFLTQFQPDVALVLCALIGRSLFKLKQLDNWQVMPFLVGVAGTGKSLIMNVCAAMFAKGAAGNLAAKREEVFGMANLVDKEVVLGHEMPEKMSASLSQEVMQTMVAGDDMEIPVKGQKAIHQAWTAPLIMASNHMPDYKNTGGNVGRRIVTVRFDNVVQSTRFDLENRILGEELPNVIHRCLLAYSTLRRMVKEAGGFWPAIPSIMWEWKGMLAEATNPLSSFLAMDEVERGCRITLTQGSFTLLDTFRELFEAKFNIREGADRKEKIIFKPDASVFASGGFNLASKREHICRSCGKIASKGCCPRYAESNRGKKTLIFNMEIIRLPKYGFVADDVDLLDA